MGANPQHVAWHAGRGQLDESEFRHNAGRTARQHDAQHSRRNFAKQQHHAGYAWREHKQRSRQRQFDESGQRKERLAVEFDLAELELSECDFPEFELPEFNKPGQFDLPRIVLRFFFHEPGSRPCG